MPGYALMLCSVLARSLFAPQSGEQECVGPGELRIGSQAIRAYGRKTGAARPSCDARCGTPGASHRFRSTRCFFSGRAVGAHRGRCTDGGSRTVRRVDPGVHAAHAYRSASEASDSADGCASQFIRCRFTVSRCRLSSSSCRYRLVVFSDTWPRLSRMVRKSTPPSA